MVSISLSHAYQLHANDFWPSLTRHQEIPAPFRSQYATPGKPSCVGMGMVLAVVSLLRVGRINHFAFDESVARWRLRLTSSTTPGAVYSLGGQGDAWWVDHPSYLIAVVGIVDALTAARSDPAGDELRQRWVALLGLLGQEFGSAPPYGAQQLVQAARVPDCTRAMMALVDATYFYIAHQRASSLAACHEASASGNVLGRADDVAHWLYGQPRRQTPPAAPSRTRSRASAAPIPPPAPPGPTNSGAGVSASTPNNGAAFGAAAPSVSGASPAAPPAAVDLSQLATLQRVIGRGSTALLIGGTGVGKSELARAAAVASGAYVVPVAGMPGLEDRDLYGGSYEQVSSDGVRSYPWVDGPLAEAWRAAAMEQHVVLLIDELGRFDPLCLAPLIGGLDRVSGALLLRAVGLSEAERARIDPERRYRVLRMRNGEKLIALASHLAVIATSNLGGDYVQMQQDFDAALLRRFEVLLDVEEMESDTRCAILERAHGLPRPVATCMVACHDWSLMNTATHNGLLRRPLNLGKCADWAMVGRDLVADGMPWRDAVAAAADMTIVGYCCAREDDGYVERAAAQALRDQVHGQARTL
jgi:hypothetical protein